MVVFWKLNYLQNHFIDVLVNNSFNQCDFKNRLNSFWALES